MKIWTNQSIYKEAKKYSTKSDWFKFSNTTYELAKRRGIFEECTSRMVHKNRPPKWTEESILDEASKLSSISDCLERSPKSYDAASRNGWISQCLEHMARPSYSRPELEILNTVKVLGKDFKSQPKEQLQNIIEWVHTYV